MINLLKKMVTVMPLQKVEDVLEDVHANSRLNQAMRVIKKHPNPTRKSMNHVRINQKHQAVEEEAATVAAEEAVVVAVPVDVVVQAVVAAATVEVAIAVEEADIEVVDVVAAVVVKEVIVPLANKKSKTVITLPFNFHLISELFYHLEQKTLSHHYSSLKIGLHHQK